MAINLSDLPPRYQAQAAAQINTQARGRKQPPATPEPESKPGKYHNRKAERVLEDGAALKFDSQKEARRYDELALLYKAGKIRDLRLQPQYTLQEAYTTPEGQRVRAIRYQADFEYHRPTEPDVTGAVYWIRVVEDVKSEATKTRVYGIKRKLMRERLGIEIKEV